MPQFDKLKLARHDPFVLKCNWKFVFDQRECYHCPVIHPQIMGKDGSYLQHSFEITAHDYWSQHLIRANRDVVATTQGNLPYSLGADDELRTPISGSYGPTTYGSPTTARTTSRAVEPAQSRTTHIAMPMPPPMQSVARPFFASRLTIS